MNTLPLHTEREKTVPFAVGFAVLLITFLLLYQPWQIGLHDLLRAEGIYAAEAQEFGPGLPVCTAHGVIIRWDAPLYPLLAAGLHRTGVPLTWALRLIPLAATMLLAGLVFWAARSARPAGAALIAAAIFLSFLLTVDKTLIASPQTLAAFGLLAAHLVWFHYAARRNSWNSAWLLSCAIMVPTVWAGGLKMLLFYAFPLIFMRRPLTIWPKLNKPGMAAGAAVLAAGLLLWLAPQWLTPGAATDPARFLPEPDWGRLLTFPGDLLVRLLPWSPLLWIPFCVALQPLDETPIFGRFLRTLACSTFFLLWLAPGWQSSDMIFLAGPLAILLGCGYETAVRRYSHPIRSLGRAAACFTCGTAFALLLFLLLPEQLLQTRFDLHLGIDFREEWLYRTLSMLIIAALLAGGAAGVFGGKRNPVWLHFLFAAAAAGMFWWTVIRPYHAQDHARAELGDFLASVLEKEQLPRTEPVYKIDIREFYCETSRIGHPIRKIAVLEELPDSAPTVYLLATEFPQFPRRDWENLLPLERQSYFGRRIGLWRGTLRPEEEE